MDETATQEFQAFSIRIPLHIHRAARLKSVRTRKTMNEIIVKKLTEWVNEPDTQPAPTAKKTVRRNGKTPVAA